MQKLCGPGAVCGDDSPSQQILLWNQYHSCFTDVAVKLPWWLLTTQWQPWDLGPHTRQNFSALSINFPLKVIYKKKLTEEAQSFTANFHKSIKKIAKEISLQNVSLLNSLVPLRIKKHFTEHCRCTFSCHNFVEHCPIDKMCNWNSGQLNSWRLANKIITTTDISNVT